MDIIMQELAGIHGNRVLRDMNDTIKMYEAYDGNLQWENELGEIDYIPTRKKKIEDPKTHKEKEIQLYRIKELN